MRRLPPLYALTDSAVSGLTHREQARRLARAGVRLIQIRAKELDSRALYEEVLGAVAAVRGSGARIIVNDRVDVAALSPAAGVHLGEEDMPARWARRILGPRKLIGVSAHAPETALAAGRDAAVDYVALGPIFATRSKRTEHPVLGLEAIRSVAARLGKPLVAIGGIGLQHVDAVLDAGAASVAAIRLFLEDGRIAANCRRLERHLSI